MYAIRSYYAVGPGLVPDPADGVLPVALVVQERGPLALGRGKGALPKGNVSPGQANRALDRVLESALTLLEDLHEHVGGHVV